MKHFATFYRVDDEWDWNLWTHREGSFGLFDIMQLSKSKKGDGCREIEFTVNSINVPEYVREDCVCEYIYDLMGQQQDARMFGDQVLSMTMNLEELG